MNNEKENKKKRKLAGVLGAFLFTLITAGLISFTWLETDEVKQEPVQLIEFDFSGSTKKGGSGSKAEQVEEVKEPQADPIKTQTEESPVKKSTSKKSTTKKSSTPKTNSKAMADGMFGGKTAGNGSGNDNGDGTGLGTGEDGPGTTGKSGPLSRGAISKPSPENPINEVGNVAVQITVNQDGKVISAEVLRNHPNTTSNNPEHFTAAKKAALKIRYSPSRSAAEYETGIVTIRFTLN